MKGALSEAQTADKKKHDKRFDFSPPNYRQLGWCIANELTSNKNETLTEKQKDLSFSVKTVKKFSSHRFKVHFFSTSCEVIFTEKFLKLHSEKKQNPSEKKT